MLGFPRTAAISPRSTLRVTDSCGESIGSDVSVSVCTGFAGSLMSSTATPSESADAFSAFSGNSRAVS